MKFSLKTLYLFLFVFSSLIILQSCGSENLITAPNESNSVPMLKVSTLPTIHINHKVDTTITLPKSKLQIVINKNYSNSNLLVMDNYYAANKNSSTIKTQSIQPNYRWCPYHTDSVMVLFDIYQPAPGKNMGIWPNLSVESIAFCWQYGFNQILLPDLSYYNEAKVAGYEDYNIGVLLPKQHISDVQNALNIINSGYKLGYYCIDEPIDGKDGEAYDGQAAYYIVNSIAPAVANLNNNSKLILTTFRPTTSYCAGAAPTGGTLKDQIAQYFPNTIRIFCDQYHGNCCGNVGWFWNDYANFYGTTLNPSNFMDVLINNGGGTAECWPSFTSTDFTSLFTNYNSHGDNTAWLYAGNLHGLSDVINYIVNVAYQRAHWVVRQYRYLIETWQNTDGTCDWPNGEWKLVSSHYSSFGWIFY